jgi:LysM repeat protein
MKSNVLLVSLSAALLAACGAASGSSPDQTTLGLTSTNYVTVTQTPTTIAATTVPGAVGAPGTVHPEEGSYVIAQNDFPSTIAAKYKVAFQDLLDINGWTLQGNQVPEFPAVGATIKIPPGWTEPGTAPDTSGGTSTGTTPSESTTTIAGGQPACAPGEYTIVAGDFPAKVAKSLDTTVDALNAANVGTKGYASFQVGVKIKTPPKANC